MMTYCEGAILSALLFKLHLTSIGSLSNQEYHSAVSSICNRWLCNAGSVQILIQIERFSKCKTTNGKHE